MKTKPKSTRAKQAHKIIAGLKETVDALAPDMTVKMVWQAANLGAGSAANRAEPEHSEVERVMLDASGEIERMRHRIEILQAKVDMIDLFGLVLMTQPRSSGQGMGEDIAWKLRKVVRDMKAEKSSGAAK